MHPHSRKEKDSIAQLVEHITFNDGVLGSSPSRVTIFLSFNAKDSIAQLVEHITFNDGVLGSSPSRVTKSRARTLGFFYLRPRGEIGRLASLRGWCSQGRVGSNPIVVTEKASLKQLAFFYFKSFYDLIVALIIFN